MKKNLGNTLFFVMIGLLFVVLACQVGLLPLRFTYFRSGSMEPTYWTGDLGVIYVDQNLEAKPGDVVLFRTAGSPTIHRVVAVENGLITTQGDANSEPDPVKLKRIDGKVLFAIPKLGYGIAYVQDFIAGLLGG